MSEITRKELVLALISCAGAPRLAGLDLSGLNLAGLNLEDADLRGANLEGANLQGTLLDGAILDDVIGLLQVEDIEVVPEVAPESAVDPEPEPVIEVAPSVEGILEGAATHNEKVVDVDVSSEIETVVEQEKSAVSATKDWSSLEL